MRIAIIDLGSNSVRMNIVNIDPEGSYSMVDQTKEMVRLSEGMGQEKLLQPIPMKRTIDSIKLFQRLIVAYGVMEVYPICTAAVRSAANQKEFLDRVSKETGLEFRVITGYEEAYYDYVGVINSIDDRDFIMIDIGGGSTELALVKNREMKEAISIPYGSVTLTEQFLGHGQDKQAIARLETFFKELLDKVQWLDEGKGLPIVGLGGVVRTIAKVNRYIIGFPLVNMHNYRMRSDEVGDVFRMIFKTSVEKISDIQGVNRRRSDIMKGGLIPIKALMDCIQPKTVVISGNGLRDGIFYEWYLRSNALPIKVNDVLEHSLDNTLKRYNINRFHCKKVQDLAVTLFDGVQETFKLNDYHRKILKTAALLHDIGMHIDYYNHQYHGFYLVLNSRLYGLTNKELISIAFLVGMHREADVKESWRNYDMLVNKDDMKDIRRLCMLIKIAEKLDRSESGLIQELEVAVDENEKKITVIGHSYEDIELEVVAATQYNLRFKKAFGYDIEFKQAEREM